jgi:hypothetical protein
VLKSGRKGCGDVTLVERKAGSLETGLDRYNAQWKGAPADPAKSVLSFILLVQNK